MKRSLSSRQGLLLVSQGAALALLLAGGSRCSSSSGNVVTGDDGGSSSGTSSSGATSSSGGGSSGASSGSTSSSGTSSSGGSGSGGGSSSGPSDSGLVIEASADGSCPTQTASTLAAKITFPVSWASTIASDSGTGSVSIWLLTDFTGTTALTGKSHSCGTTLPDLGLNGLGATAAGHPTLTDGMFKVQIQIPNSTWDAITTTFPVTATQSGFNPGDSLNTMPALGLIGLLGTSSFSMAATAWPPACASNSTTCQGQGAFTNKTDVTDDDHDNLPGITAAPENTNGYVWPPTATTCGAPADKVYIVSRNQLELDTMHMTDCTHGAGTAKITLFDNHVVGCHAASFSCPALNNGATQPAADCTNAQAAFLDQNRTIYGYDTSSDVASPTHPIMGTVTAVELAASATCADVRAALK